MNIERFAPLFFVLLATFILVGSKKEGNRRVFANPRPRFRIFRVVINFI